MLNVSFRCMISHYTYFLFGIHIVGHELKMIRLKNEFVHTWISKSSSIHIISVKHYMLYQYEIDPITQGLKPCQILSSYSKLRKLTVVNDSIKNSNMYLVNRVVVYFQNSWQIWFQKISIIIRSKLGDKKRG